MTVRELIQKLSKQNLDCVVELEAGGNGSYLDPHTVRREGDVVMIISCPEDEEGEDG